ncbi:hypothetical protein Q9233_008314 [Columba guinea]|nr:hypothetical protein Q9233_008314 [Columba guinea]
MDKEKPFKLFVPPRLSGGQVSAVKPQANARATGLCQGFNKCPDDDFNMPFLTSTPNCGEISDSDEHERDETRQLYVELNNNVEISVLTIQSDEKDDIIREIKTQLQESKNKIADLVEAKRHEEEMLKESQIKLEHLRAELEEANVFLQKAEIAQKSLETDLQTAVKALAQVTAEKEAEMEECEKTKALHACLREEFETSVSNLKSLLQKEQNRSEKYEDESKRLTLELRNKSAELGKLGIQNLQEIPINELESLKEKMVKKGEEIQSQLDEREENVCHINKVLKKKITAESKKTSAYEGKVNKLQLEMENMNKQHKETVDIYQKDMETKKVNENKLLEEMRSLADKATVAQRETDIQCRHKITEMVALMEKHKHEYDKMVEEKDTELKLYKIKEQEQLSSKRSLESELSSLKSELSSLKEQLKAEIEEKTYSIKTPPTPKLQSESTNLYSDQCMRKKQKVLLQLDAHSDSSEHSDLLDSNGKKLLLKSALSQNVCTYKEMMYQTVMIPGCPRHTVPYYSYPVAVSCKCGKCNTDYSDCVHEKWNKDFLTCECQVLLDIMDHLNDTRSLAELLPIVY